MQAAGKHSGCSRRLENMLFGLSLGWDEPPKLFSPRIPHGFSATQQGLGLRRLYSGAAGLLGVPFAREPARKRQQETQEATDGGFDADTCSPVDP